MVKQYRKKPVVIKAMCFTGNNGIGISKWCGGNLVDGGTRWPSFVEIDTIEGRMLAMPGDYIIKGVQGEFYPCKPDIFAQTYELVK